jgi:hypothetical protein
MMSIIRRQSTNRCRAALIRCKVCAKKFPRSRECRVSPRTQILEASIQLRKQHFVNENPVLGHVQPPPAHIGLATLHQLTRNQTRVLKSMLSIGDQDLVAYGTLAIVQLEGILSHS